ncbi:MAG: FAD-binding oxidoreductase [Gammaproteobacteria bacterium]|nr:FAD-binding oxidoreductase [Gammaproteobacteria bacterium]MYD77299.1 FAD-binding oxidoreductase [Gammaproteobacteria bacterium]MYJ51873.1 FAD-binding oxidoreductase [Gammaproteobacteria bacterium]
MKHVAVIGCGIVGLSTAIWLQRTGHRVTLIDKSGPASGATFGNAGVLAACSVVPVTSPGLTRKIPKLLLDRNSPLFLIWSYLPSLFPWIFRYLGHTNPDKVRRIVDALLPLTHDSLEQHRALAAGTGAERFIHSGNYYFAYENRKAFESEKAIWELRRHAGFEWEEMTGAQFAESEPLYRGIGFAVRLERHGRIDDPGAYARALARHACAHGAVLETGKVLGFEQDHSRIRAVVTDHGKVSCDAAVVAAGAWSAPLSGGLGLSIPLESERGYHIEMLNPSPMPSHPVMISSGKFVVTPMNGRLRCAGVIEFGGLDAGAQGKPLDFLKRRLRSILPDIRHEGIEEWFGHRPAPVDSIPYIGEVPGVKGAYLAFGHHHIGLTSGAKTGRLIAELISTGHSSVPLDSYRIRRS